MMGTGENKLLQQLTRGDQAGSGDLSVCRQPGERRVLARPWLLTVKLHCLTASRPFQLTPCVTSDK